MADADCQMADTDYRPIIGVPQLITESKFLHNAHNEDMSPIYNIIND